MLLVGALHDLDGGGKDVEIQGTGEEKKGLHDLAGGFRTNVLARPPGGWVSPNLPAITYDCLVTTDLSFAPP